MRGLVCVFVEMERPQQGRGVRGKDRGEEERERPQQGRGVRGKDRGEEERERPQQGRGVRGKDRGEEERERPQQGRGVRGKDRGEEERERPQQGRGVRGKDRSEEEMERPQQGDGDIRSPHPFCSLFPVCVCNKKYHDNKLRMKEKQNLCSNSFPVDANVRRQRERGRWKRPD